MAMFRALSGNGGGSAIPNQRAEAIFAGANGLIRFIKSDSSITESTYESSSSMSGTTASGNILKYTQNSDYTNGWWTITALKKCAGYICNSADYTTASHTVAYFEKNANENITTELKFNQVQPCYVVAWEV